MANKEIVLSRRLFTFAGLTAGTALAVKGVETLFSENTAASLIRFDELTWGGLKKYTDTALFVDARVEGIEGRRSRLPDGIKNIIEVQYDHEQPEKDFMFVDDKQKAIMIEHMSSYERVVVICEAGTRGEALAKRIVEISNEIGSTSKVKKVHNLSGGLRGLTDEDRIIEARIESHTEGR